MCIFFGGSKFTIKLFAVVHRFAYNMHNVMQSKIIHFVSGGGGDGGGGFHVKF